MDGGMYGGVCSEVGDGACGSTSACLALLWVMDALGWVCCEVKWVSQLLGSC